MLLASIIAQLPLTGQSISAYEWERLGNRFADSNCQFIWDLMRSYPLAGSSFSLPHELDLSGFGVEMQWLSPTQIISEASEFYPGIIAAKQGYIPIGECLIGSGDPYFLFVGEASSDPPLFRIPHNAIINNNFVDKDGIDLVALTISHFFALATIY